MPNFASILQNLQPYVGFLTLGVVVAVIVTPMIGRLAHKIGAVDLPAALRGRGDKTSDRRIHDRVTPKLAGAVLAIPILLVLAQGSELTQLPWGILVGGLIMLVVGLADDKFELSGRQQLIAQIIAAICVTSSGLTISFIQLAGIELDLTLASTSLGLPATLIPSVATVFWIVAIINFIGWSDGVDGVHGALAIIAMLTMWFIATRVANLPEGTLTLIALILGANLGFYVYNIYPAKIFYAGSGTGVNGFFLAVIAILVTAKLGTAIILLGLPIFDALLVIYLRIKAHPEVRRNPLKILTISDRNHLHHRLLDVGYSKPSVLMIELSLMLVLCFIALTFSGIETSLVPLVGSLAIIALSFSVIAVARQRLARKQKILAEAKLKQPQIEVKYEPASNQQPSEKFTY